MSSLSALRVRGCGSGQGVRQNARQVRNCSCTRSPLESGARDGDSPVADGGATCGHHPSTPGHEKPWGNPGGPPSKAKYPWPPIANQYREGKVKSTPGRGVKQNLKPVAYKQWELDRLRPRVTACLLQNEPASHIDWQRLSPRRDGAAGKPSPNRALRKLVSQSGPETG